MNMWSLEYVRKFDNDSSILKGISKKYLIQTKDQLKDIVSKIMSVELDADKNPIEPTLDIVKRYCLFNNDLDKLDSILKFFKKNYERYLEIIQKTNDFEIQENFKYDIVDQADYYYLDRLFLRDKEIFKESYFFITVLNEDEKKLESN